MKLFQALIKISKYLSSAQPLSRVICSHLAAATRAEGEVFVEAGLQHQTPVLGDNSGAVITTLHGTGSGQRHRGLAAPCQHSLVVEDGLPREQVGGAGQRAQQQEAGQPRHHDSGHRHRLSLTAALSSH